MKNISRGWLLAAAAAISVNAYAQNHPAAQPRHEITVVNGRADAADTVDVYEIFRENAPKAFNVPGAPRFAIAGKDGKFYLGIGGTAKATVAYDWGNPIQNAYDFTTSAIPMSQAQGNGGLLQFSAATSGLFVNFVAMPGSKHQLGVYFNFNLTGNGNNYGFNLNYAYINYFGFTVGYDYSLFSDMAATPPSIDNEGPNALTAIPKGVVDYRHSFNDRWSIGAGIEIPIASPTTGSGTAAVNQRVPDIPAYVQFAWGKGSGRIRLSAIVRNMLWRDLPADRNRDCVGWGVKLSGTASPLPWLTAYYQAACGSGITSYFQDLYQGGLDMTPARRDGRLRPVKAWGAYLGLQYTISPKVYATTTYSHLRTYARSYDGGSTPWGEQYRYGQYALANVIWNITTQISTGIEFIYGRRVDMNGISRHDNRLQTMLLVTF